MGALCLEAWGSGTPAQSLDLGITLDVSSSHLCPQPWFPFSPESCGVLVLCRDCFGKVEGRHLASFQKR